MKLYSITERLSDRFLQVIRGYEKTVEQFWSAGAYLRQIEDVTVLSAAVASINLNLMSAWSVHHLQQVDLRGEYKDRSLLLPQCQ